MRPSSDGLLGDTATYHSPLLQLKVEYGSGNRSCMAERYSTKARAFG